MGLDGMGCDGVWLVAMMDQAEIRSFWNSHPY
jgi:hypothetical protein